MSKPGKRIKLSKTEVEREVSLLFPNTEYEPTEEEWRFFRALKVRGKFAFAIDRQSVPKAAKNNDATGMKRRVEAIRGMAQRLDFYLPDPILRSPPVDGELPYLFDDDCGYLWYVDGTDKRATGFAANQNARPRLWRAFLLAQALAKDGCAPSAFLIGEGTRFFRDQAWLQQFVNALWKRHIAVHDGMFGEVTNNTLSGYCAYITATSGWLGTVNRGAKFARRSERRIFHNKPPYGLMFSRDRSRVYGNPQEWPIIVELVDRLADGRLTSIVAAAEWLFEQGVRRSRCWVQGLMHSPILDGRYHAYKEQYTPRMLKQKGDLFFDLDITEGGSRRYLVTETEGDVWIINHDEHGTQPINPVALRAARARVFRNQGRPRLHGGPAEVLVGMRLLRCAVCGHGVSEHVPGGRPDQVRRDWHLACRANPTLKARQPAIDRTPPPPHRKCRAGRISLLVWERLVLGLRETPIDPEPAELNLAVEQDRIEQQVRTAKAAFFAFQEKVMEGQLGDMKDPEVAEFVERKRQEFLASIRNLEVERGALAEKVLLQQRLNASIIEAQKALRWMTEGELTNPIKREIIEQLVERVVVNLETGEFTIYVDTTYAQLRQLSGRMGFEVVEGIDNNVTCSGAPNIIRYTLTGTMAA